MRRKAFTLFELLLAMSLLGMIAAISAPFLSQVVGGNELQTAVDVTVQSLRRSQTLARTGEDDASWGTYVTPGGVTVFRGTSYATRDAQYDEVTAISVEVGVSGVQEFVFAPVTGEPGAAGSLTLTSLDESWTVTVNSKGVVTF
ncbi:MAG: hypothetical protein TR69_WS6001000629 [candidate division WS6 bacterium OLB20]|uniref:General secretion pathway GspH domain-containing protein n=1 Tax=candidate division WS6 bacterium OLB20 TaxID=1617426 RepID=A0A136LY78_9BACT|nr:MAG: hypothetical protein TR69_WS6001000629 [candidate division WS6 bacterium OLB20]